MVDINLLPWRALQSSQKKREKMYMITSVVILCLLIFVVNHFRGIQKQVAAVPEKQTIYREADRYGPLIKQLKMIGFLSENEKTWAIILWPDGKVQDIEVGTKISSLYATVLSIQNKYVVLEGTDKRKYVIASHKEIL